MTNDTRALDRRQQAGALATPSPTAAIDAFKLLLPDWFIERIDFDGPIPSHRPELGPCWIWTGVTANGGYGWIGRLSVREYAHRLSSIYTGGPLPSRMCVLHACDNPPCVRPGHLFRGTQADNMRDMNAKGRNGATSENRAHGAANGACTHPERRPKGETHGQAKLSKQQAAEIRSMYAERTISQRQLAARFGVSQRTVLRVVNGRSWSDGNSHSQAI
jgi:DNA-binding transcriptional regulator YiaG